MVLCGLGATWFYQPRITKAIETNLSLTDQSLNYTESILATVNQVVESTKTDVTSLQETTSTMAAAIKDANPMLDTLIKLTGKDLPTTIDTTQSSLASAESTALLIDNVLGALTKVPFSPIAPYKPAIPLHTALANVSSSLNSLKPSLQEINTSIATGKTNMDTVGEQLSSIAASTQGINDSLNSAQADVSGYQTAINQLKDNVEKAQRTAPRTILIASWIITLLLVWILITQAGLGILGLSILQERKVVEDLQESRQL